MIQGSWVGVPITVSFSFFCFPFCPSSPMTALNARVGVGGFVLSLDPFLLLRSSHFSFLLLSFLGVGVRQPRSGGIRYLPNK